MIRITSFAKAKENAKGNGSSGGFTTSIKTELDTHYLWGQPFNGTQDVDGDMDVNGNINVYGDLAVGGDVKLNSDLTVVGDIQSNSVTTGTIDATNGNINLVNSQTVNTTDVNATNGEIENLISENAGISNLNVDVLNAKQAHFWELVIDKMRSTNGTFILSPANARIEKFETLYNKENVYYRLMWRTTDLQTNKAITNDFEVNDQIISMSFNQANAVNNYDISNKYYWVKVISKGTTTAYDTLRETTCDWHYIIVGEQWDGELNIEVGDEICVLGNTTDTDRQNAIIISSVNSTFLDEDLEAPSIAQYKGIKTFELKPYRMNVLSSNNNTFYGNFNVIVGDSSSDVKDLINDSKSNIASIQTDSLATFIMADSESKISSINAANGLVKKIEVYLGNDIIPTSEIQATSYVQWRGEKWYVNKKEPHLLREGIDISSLQIKDNYIAVNWDYHGKIKLISGQETDTSDDQETTASNTECKIYINFIHNGTTYEKVFTVTATVIMSDKGTDAEFEKLVVDNFEAIVTLEDKLKISGTAYIQHIKGNNITRVTDLANYTLDAVSNAGDKFNFNKSNYFYYTNSNYITNYSKQSNTQTKYTVRLFKNTNKIDELVFPVTFDSGAIFQVKADAITSAVSQSKTYTDGQITTVKNSISTIEQKADSISSRVKNIENDYVTSSELTQTANNIQLNVYNELNEKTGIDVRNGQITLNADNTTIVGNLNLTNTENGLTVYDEFSVPRINIQPKKIDDITTETEDVLIPYIYSYSNKNAKEWNGTSTVYSITLKKNETLDIRRIVCWMFAENSNQIYYPANGSAAPYAYGSITITKPDNTTQKINLVMQGRGYGKFEQIGKKTYIAEMDGTYKITFNMYCTETYQTSYPNLIINMNCVFEVTQTKQTYVGLDGMYVHNGASKHVYISEDKTQIQFCANGIRWNESIVNGTPIGGNSAMEVAVAYNGTKPTSVVWVPFYNYVPIFKPSNWENGTIINTGDTNKYYYNIDVQKDRGICVIDTVPLDSNNRVQDAWILLPNKAMEDGNGNVGYFLPVGYQITIVNHTFLNGHKCNVYVSGQASRKNEVVIVDSRRDQNYYCNLSNAITSDTYIYMGSYYSSDTGINTMYWQTRQDTQ